MVRTMLGASTGYQAAYEGAIYWIIGNSGYLRLAGPDRRDFLQRQSTNDVRGLDEDRSVTTVLTSPTARILDVLCLTQDGEAVGIMTLPGRGAATHQFLRSRIFFMDQVTLDDASQQIVQIDLDGSRVKEALARHEVEMPSNDGVHTLKWGQTPVCIVARSGLLGPACRLLVSSDALSDVVRALENVDIYPIAEEAREIIRVEAGQPGPRTELTEDYTPLEVGLRQIISDQKGCYTGQEIIARQITYDRVTRHLASIALEEPVAVGAAVEAEGRTIGEVTSAVNSPRLGPLALAVVRRPYHEPGTALRVVQDERIVSAKVRS